MEAGYFEKVGELCERYSLEGFANVKGMMKNFLLLSDLHLETLVLHLSPSKSGVQIKPDPKSWLP